jgi:hypothetical protein
VIHTQEELGLGFRDSVISCNSSWNLSDKVKGSAHTFSIDRYRLSFKIPISSIDDNLPQS